MSGEYVRSATSRQERDTSGECRKWVGLDISEAYMAELEARVAALTEAVKYAHDNSDIRLNTGWKDRVALIQESDDE